MTYAAEVLADTPTVFYECEESAGTTAADSSGNGNDGTIFDAGLVYDVPTAPGCGNGFTVGVGVGDPRGTINVPHAAWNPGAGDFTIEAVVRIDLDLDIVAGALPIYACDDGGTNSLIGWIFTSTQSVSAGGPNRPGIAFLSVFNGTVVLGEFPNDQLAHLVQFTYDSAAETVLSTVDGVDGVPTAVGGTLTMGALANSVFAGLSDNDPEFAGDVDSLALYDHQLTSDRRLAHYRAAFPAVGPPAVPGTAGYRWEVLVRNHDLSIAGELGVIDLELHPKYQDIGTWTVDFDWDGDPVNAAAIALMQRGAGLVFRLNDRNIMSGPWTKPVKTRTGDQRSYTVNGVDDNQILADRAAHPQPRSAAPPYLVYAQDVRGPGAAETVIKAFVNGNAGPGAVPARRVAGLRIAPDLALGGTVKGLGDWTKQLDVLVQSLAQAGGIGYRTIQTDRPGLEFQVWLPADKSDTVVFGVEVGNLAGYSYGAQRPAGNYVYVLGSGEGTARTVREGQNAESVGAYGRIEAVADSSNSDDLVVLGQQIATELAAKAEQFSASITAIDTRQHQWAPVAPDPTSAYDLGDRVSVLIDGVQIIETITELQITFNADAGTQVIPTVGTPFVRDPLDRLIGALVKLARTQQRQIRQQQGR